MVKIKSSSKIDYKKIQRIIRSDTILVGFPEGIPHNKSKNTNLDEIAMYLSEKKGQIWMPFLYDGILTNKTEIRTDIKEQYERMFEGKPPNLHKIGVNAVRYIQAFVRSGSTGYSISEKTKWRKTSKAGKKKGQLKERPLIDTGQLIGGVTHAVMGAK